MTVQYKKIAIVFLVFLSLAAAAWATMDGDILLVPKTRVAPVIDGVLDPVWRNSTEIICTHYSNGPIPPDNWFDLGTTFRLMWDDNYIYGFADQTDDSLVDAHANTWEQDAVEFLFDADNSKGTSYDGVNDVQLTFRHWISAWQDILRSGGWFDRSTVEFINRNKDNGLGWTLEWKIPLNALGFSQPLAGTPFGWEVHIDDNDSDHRDHVGKWWAATGDDSWHDPSTWGTARLDDRVVSDTLDVHRAITAPVIDGTLDDAWKNIPEISVSQYSFTYTPPGLPDGPSDCSETIRVMWDANCMYCFVSIKDDTLVRDSGTDQYKDDSFQFYFDGDYSHGTSYDGLNDLNISFPWDATTVVGDLIGNYPPGTDLSRIAKAGKKTADGWNVETAIPLDLLAIPPVDGHIFGIEVDYNDDDDGDYRDHKLKYWSVDDNAWQNPSLMAPAKLVGYVGANWNAALTFSWNGKTLVRSFGGSPEASNGYDAALDAMTPPPGQVYYAYFSIPGFPSYLSTDVRHWDSPFKEDLSWTAKVINADGIASSVSWDPAELPACGKFILSGSGSGDVDMRTTGSIAMTGSKTLTIRYLASVTMNYVFSQAGWYMVSLPVIPTDSSVATLFPTALGGMAFGWDPTGAYTTETKMKPKKGYWIAIPGAATANVTGLPLNSYTEHLAVQGWYMIGSVLGTVNFADPNDNPAGSVLSPAFGWDPALSQYVPATTLNEKEGYWIAVFNACDLTVGGAGGESATPLAKADWEAFYRKNGKTPPSPPTLDGKTSKAIETPKEFGLFQNYPNPFNPETTIRYQIPDAGFVRLAVYNTMGQVVRRLVDEHQNPGSYEVVWDGKDERGQSMVSGMYLVRMEAGSYVSIRKVLLMK
jgi:hypothetical protein